MLIDNVNLGEYQTEEGVYKTGHSVSIVLSEEEVQILLAEYDPASATSPSVATCRPIVRAILERIVSVQ